MPPSVSKDGAFMHEGSYRAIENPLVPPAKQNCSGLSVCTARVHGSTRKYAGMMQGMCTNWKEQVEYWRIGQ